MNGNQDLAELVIKYAQAVKKREEKRIALKKKSDRMLRWVLERENHDTPEVLAQMSRGVLQQTLVRSLGFDEMVDIYGDRLKEEYAIDLDMLGDFIVDLS